jgi:hypothetical protein
MQGAKAAEQTKTKVTIQFLLSLANGRRIIVNDGSLLRGLMSSTRFVGTNRFPDQDTASARV